MAKKIAFVGFTKIKYMPYMRFYLDLIDTELYEVHLIYWNRDKSDDFALNGRVCCHSFEQEMEDTIPLAKKIPNILGFGRYARAELLKINPDALIVMHSTTAITIYSYLKHKYSGKYIFDFRDITYERYGVYRKLVGNIVRNSFVTFTSSNDFKRYLPSLDKKIYTSHNIIKADLLERNTTKKQITYTNDPIRIAFWGLIRHTEYNRIIIDKLGNDGRFELHYYGRATGADLQLMENSEACYNNVFFHGEYMPRERKTFAQNTDLLHNLYSNQDATTPHAMGNKFYDGLIFKIPQLCSTDSYMGKLCSSSGVGLECDPTDPEFAEKIVKYYRNLDSIKFTRACEVLLKDILEEIQEGEQKINEFIEKQ